MKSKRLLLSFVFVLAFMLALAISSYASTITLYSGADNTTSSTTHNGSLALTGNTEENETVTVYFTDDGRAWKAGETVSFKEDTNLYTIECTKLSTNAEYNAATGGGNYIITADLNFTKSDSGPINGDNCTTRIFMNGKSITMGNSNSTMLQGNSHSVYLLGKGYISSAWGGPLYRGHCNSSKIDVTWLIGKDITIEVNKDPSAVFYVFNNLSSKSLNIHIYGKIIKAQSGNTGAWNLLSIYYENTSTDYNIYFHEGSSVELLGYIVSCGRDGSADGLGNLIFEGGAITLPSANYFYHTPAATAFVGTLTLNSGTFTIANADTLTEFKVGIVSDKKAQDIDATSFRVVCNECNYVKTLGDDFIDLTHDFTINDYCPNCKTTGNTTKVTRVFEAKGYSISPNGTAINCGYGVNPTSLDLYKEVIGDVKYGIVIANADAFDGKSFFDENNAVNTDKAMQIEVDSIYSNFNCSINFGTTSNNMLKLVICAYVIDANGTSFIQHSTGDLVGSSNIADGIFKSITLDMIATSQSTTTVSNKEN